MPALPRLLVVAAALVFLALASLSAGWIVDDAGISFAYSRTLAAGHGLRAQPGAPAVEGFSNPLWVMLFALLYGVGAVALPLTPKLVGLALVLVAARAAWIAARSLGEDPEAGAWIAAGALWFSAGNIAVVHWALSGLENPLTLALALGGLAATLGLLAEPGSRGRATATGLLAGAALWNRPDGAALALAPLATGAVLALARRRAPPWLGRVAGLVAGATLLLWATRWACFGALLPNTYLVKGGPRWQVLAGLVLGEAAAWDHARGLLIRVFGSAVSGPVLAVTGLAALALAWRRRLGAGHLALAMYLGATTATYLLLPPDWMDETRFATAAYPLAYLAVLAVWSRALGADPARRPRGLAAIVACLSLVALPDAYFRVLRAEGRANISLDFVDRAFARRFNALADELGIQEGVLATQDLGGALLGSRLRVVDLAGLCDRRVAETLGKDPAALREYLFGEVRPDFLVLHGPWAEAIRAEQDPRLAADYVAIFAASGPMAEEAGGHAQGVYVRRDHLAGHPARLAALRAREHRLESFDREPDRGPLWGWLLAVPGLPRPRPETLTHPGLGDAPAAAKLGATGS